MIRLWRRWLPKGEGSRSWGYCEASVRGLPSYRHVTADGMRFAA